MSSVLPILDLSLFDHPDTKQAFLDALREALTKYGFFYVR
jgi:isopenicillin N synthase-like dioxygenase